MNVDHVGADFTLTPKDVELSRKPLHAAQRVVRAQHDFLSRLLTMLRRNMRVLFCVFRKEKCLKLLYSCGVSGINAYASAWLQRCKRRDWASSLAAPVGPFGQKIPQHTVIRRDKPLRWKVPARDAKIAHAFVTLKEPMADQAGHGVHDGKEQREPPRDGAECRADEQHKTCDRANDMRNHGSRVSMFWQKHVSIKRAE
jgi:hypothetical protein